MNGSLYWKMTRFPNISKKKIIIITKVGQIRDPDNCKTKRGHVQQLFTNVKRRERKTDTRLRGLEWLATRGIDSPSKIILAGGCPCCCWGVPQPHIPQCLLITSTSSIECEILGADNCLWVCSLLKEGK